MAKKYSSIVGICIMLLGLGGIGLGLGYLLKTRKPQEGGTEGDFKSMTGRDQIFGISSFGAGVAVIAMGRAVWLYMDSLSDKLGLS